jgi:hypothetical protein
MSKKFKIPEPKKKTAGEVAFEWASYMIIVCFLVWLLQTFLSYLFSPFQNAYKRDDVEKKIREDMERKIWRRTRHLELIENDERDPMHQFQLRFLAEPEEYKDDPLTERYLEWYNEWKAGNVLDTGLRWVPPIYDDDGNLNLNFIQYMGLQVKAHLRCGLGRRALFLLTIHNYFPEFTTSFTELEMDIKAYCAELETVGLRKELVGELTGYGLPEELSEYLTDNGGKDIKDQADFLRKCIEFGYSPSTSIVLLEKGIKLGSDKAKVLEEIAQAGLPEEATEAFLKGKLTRSEIHYIAEKMAEQRQEWGLNFYATMPTEELPVYKLYYKEFVKEVRSKHF